MSCSCDKNKIEEAKVAAVQRIAPYMCDVNGNRLFYVDSFGYRGPFPGECDECYDRLTGKPPALDKMNEAQLRIEIARLEDLVVDFFDAGCFAMNGVVDDIDAEVYERAATKSEGTVTRAKRRQKESAESF